MTICVVHGATPEGAAALELAVRESRRRGVVLVAVATERQQRFGADDDDRGAEPRRAEIEAQLTALRAEGDPAVRVELVDDGGDAAAAVLDLVAAQEAELLVVGVRRRSPVGKLFLGSVAQQIILESPIPVLVTHATR